MRVFALIFALPLSAQIGPPPLILDPLPAGVTLSPEGQRILSQAIANSQARPILPIPMPRIEDSEAARKSWIGVGYEVPRDAARRANEALSWIEPRRIDEAFCRDKWLDLVSSAQRMGMPAEYAVCRYLEWLGGIIDSRVSDLSGHSARLSVVREFGIDADRALRVWQAWASNLHEDAVKRLEAYSIPPERAQRLATNAERGRRQNEIFSLR